MNELSVIAQKIKYADAILIGASNGLSIAEGLHLFASNDAFFSLFGDLTQTYGIGNLISGMLARWPSRETQWGFWSRLVKHYTLSYTPTSVMKDLRTIVGDKPYFVITSNGEEHFEASGFKEDTIFEVEGNWTHLICSEGCCDNIYPGRDSIRTMAENQQGGLVPTDFLPRCPHCQSVLIPTMAAGVYDQRAKDRFTAFLQHFHGKNLIILELGIGARNQLIKAPLMKLAAMEPNAVYATFNLSELCIAPDIKKKSFGISGDLKETIHTLASFF